MMVFTHASTCLLWSHLLTFLFDSLMWGAQPRVPVHSLDGQLNLLLYWLIGSCLCMLPPNISLRVYPDRISQDFPPDFCWVSTSPSTSSPHSLTSFIMTNKHKTQNKIQWTTLIRHLGHPIWPIKVFASQGCSCRSKYLDFGRNYWCQQSREAMHVRASKTEKQLNTVAYRTPR
jgi:hypothetical protein